MADSRVKAAAVRLQRAIREYLSDEEVGNVLPGSIEPAQALLQEFDRAGVSDHSSARGRPLLRVTERRVTQYRKRAAYLTKKAKKLEKALKQARSSKKHGQIRLMWWLAQHRDSCVHQSSRGNKNKGSILHGSLLVNTPGYVLLLPNVGLCYIQFKIVCAGVPMEAHSNRAQSQDMFSLS